MSFKKFSLKPNCLLTRNDLTFISRPKSWFNYKNSWNPLFVGLLEHGYKIREFPLPFKKSEHRLHIMNKFICSTQTPTHLFIDFQDYTDLKEYFKNDYFHFFSITKPLKSLTIVDFGLSQTPTNTHTLISFNNLKSNISLLNLDDSDYILHPWLSFVEQSFSMNYFSKLKFHSHLKEILLNRCQELAELDFMQDS